MINIVHELRLAKGSKAKLAILKKHEDNKEWKAILRAMYDSSINYYISAPKDLTFVDEVDVSNLLYDLSMLSSRTYTGNEARTFALNLSREYGEISRLILDGSLRAGVSVTTINKAYPRLIPTFDVMLAKKDVPINYPCLGSIKYDGVRVLVKVQDGDATIYTRAGKELAIESLRYSMLVQGDGWYDGELVAGDGKQVSRTSITGSVNKVLKGSLNDIKGYTFCIFDKISLQEWKAKRCITSFLERSENLMENFLPTNNTVLVAQKILKSQEEADIYYSHLRHAGYEGAILRHCKDPYEWRRTAALIKLKAQTAGILQCVGVLEGKGKYEGMVGALHCKGSINGKCIIVNIGTGLSDVDREQPPEYYLDKDIDIEYNDIVKAEGHEHYSLFLPVFKRVKGDYNV